MTSATATGSRRRWRPRRLLGVAAAAVTALAGCASATSARGSGTSADGLTVFAASSLTDTFPALARSFAERGAGAGAVTFSFAGSQELVAQISHGAPADVVATADPQTMRTVADELVGPARTFAHNELVIVTAAGNPHHVETLRDLADPHLTVVLADPSVPAGHYAAQALHDAGVDVRARSLELDVRSVLTKVALGAADAGIVYRTDAESAGEKVATVPIPGAPRASYEIGALDAAGRSFVTFVLSPAGRAQLRRFGFAA